MSKIELDNITSGYNLGKINANFVKIENALTNNVLFRDATGSTAGPNQMVQDIDMDSQSILNLPTPTEPTNPVRLQDLGDYATSTELTEVDNRLTAADTVLQNNINTESGLRISADAILTGDVNSLDGRVTTLEQGTSGTDLYIHWLYNNGLALGGEVQLNIPYEFTSIATVYINGVRMSYGLAFDFDVAAKTVQLAEPLVTGDEVVVSLGVEPQEVSALVQSITEEVVLTDGQTVVTFVEQNTNGAAYYINGPSVDSRFLSSEDFTASSTTNTTITLTESYPAGSIITLSKNVAGSGGIDGDIRREFVHNEPTLAVAVTSTLLRENDAINLRERTTGNGGGAMWDVVLSTSVTENGYNIVQCTGVPTLSLVLRICSTLECSQLGFISSNTSSENGAIVNHALTLRGELSLPDGDFPCSGILINQWPVVINGEGTTLDNNSVGEDLFIFGDNANCQQLRLNLNKILSRSQAGHVFVVRELLAQVEFNVRFVQQLNINKHIMLLDWDETLRPNAGMFFVNFNGEQWGITSSHTVAAFDIRAGENRFAGNNFNFTRVDRSGDVPFYYFDCFAPAQFFYQVTFNNQSPEVIRGGVAFLKGCSYFSFNNIDCFDVSTDGDPINDIFELDSRCRSVSFTNVFRQSGSPIVGKVDIKINTGCVRTHMTNVGSHSAGVGFKIDCGSTNVRINGTSQSTIINFDPAIGNLIDTDYNSSLIHLELQRLTAERGDINISISPPSTKVISSGSINADRNYHKVDTEGSAATDDLTTINGGIDGQRLLLQSVSNGRDITLVSATGNLRTAGGVAFTLSRQTDTIEFIYNVITNEWHEISRSDNQT